MASFKKIELIIIFFVNLALLSALKFIIDIDIRNFSFDYTLASSITIRNYLILLICIGQLILILSLTKLKFVRNISNYQVRKEFYALGPILLHTQHHPACTCYQDHEFSIGNQRICSGCYGSSLGILIGIMVLFSTYFITLPFEIYFFTGVLLIQLGLLKVLFKSYIRFILNSFFPLGVNLLLSGCFTIAFGIIYALLFIPFLLIEFLLRLSTPNFDTKFEICPDGLIH